jgi:hypothetical protein
MTDTAMAVPHSAGTRRPARMLPPLACDSHMHIFDARFAPSPHWPRTPPQADVAMYRQLQQRLGGRGRTGRGRCRTGPVGRAPRLRAARELRLAAVLGRDHGPHAGHARAPRGAAGLACAGLCAARTTGGAGARAGRAARAPGRGPPGPHRSGPGRGGRGPCRAAPAARWRQYLGQAFGRVHAFLGARPLVCRHAAAGPRPGARRARAPGLGQRLAAYHRVSGLGR